LFLTAEVAKEAEETFDLGVSTGSIIARFFTTEENEDTEKAFELGGRTVSKY